MAKILAILYDTGMGLTARHHIGFVMMPGTMIGIRDTRFADSPVLSFTPSQWLAFVDDITSGGGELSYSQAGETVRHPGRFPQS